MNDETENQPKPARPAPKGPSADQLRADRAAMIWLAEKTLSDTHRVRDTRPAPKGPTESQRRASRDVRIWSANKTRASTPMVPPIKSEDAEWLRKSYLSGMARPTARDKRIVAWLDTLCEDASVRKKLTEELRGGLVMRDE